MQNQSPQHPISTSARARFFGFTLFIALLLLVVSIGTLAVSAEGVDLSGSTKSVDKAEAKPGDTLAYTIVLTNSGTATPTLVTLTDTLPTGTSYLTGTLTVTHTGVITHSAAATVTNGMLTWSGLIGDAGMVTFDFSALVADDMAYESTITNTVMFTGTGEMMTRSAETTFPSPVVFLPIIHNPPVPPVLNAPTRPNNANEWSVSWSAVPGAAGYYLEESQSSTFETIKQNWTLDSATTTQAISHSPQVNNEFYYRVRTILASTASDWSNWEGVIAAYHDGFTDANSGWDMRRTTYIEEVRTWYERTDEEGWLILQSEDSWDWGIISAMKRAPEPPYTIQYRSQPASLGNLISYGLIFGGDWGGEACQPDIPVAGDDDAIDAFYQHKNCFNHFYNTNVINKNLFSPDVFKMIFESNGYLEWCLECAGSPMKRFRNNAYDSSFLWAVEPIPHTNSDGWNTWNVEVRENSIKIYINGNLIGESAETDWINDPYFGFFVSTDEYSNSTWRIDYIEIRALDN